MEEEMQWVSSGLNDHRILYPLRSSLLAHCIYLVQSSKSCRVTEMAMQIRTVDRRRVFSIVRRPSWTLAYVGVLIFVDGKDPAFDT